MYNPAIHNRKSIRLKNYDYSDEGLYFITLCAAQRKKIFGKIINGELQLNKPGIIAEEEWQNTTEIRKNISLGAFIIMPNHIHGIIIIDYKSENKEKENTGEFNLSGKGSIWQRNYYEHIIKTEKAYRNITNYIINNPRNWEDDKLNNNDEQ